VSALAGRTIVVTRPREQAAPFAAQLVRRGARVVVFPTIATRAADPAEADRAIARLETYAWVIFPSANAVRFFLERVTAAGRAGLPAGVRVAAVGRATAALLEERGVRVDAVPEEFLGTALAAALGEVHGLHLLLPRADIGRAETVASLEAAGARVDAITVYHTVPAEPDAVGLAALVEGVDAVTFTSPSTFTNFTSLLRDRAAALLARVTIASIGPVTSAAIRAAGFPVHIEPAEHTTAALAAALDTHFASHAPRVAGDRS
jgi:uroporphyrinogen-III synthase